jgi:hypothetical protein
MNHLLWQSVMLHFVFIGFLWFSLLTAFISLNSFHQLSTDVSEVRAASINDPCRWRQHLPLKRPSTIILHGSTSLKTILNFILAAVRTWKFFQNVDERDAETYPASRGVLASLQDFDFIYLVLFFSQQFSITDTVFEIIQNKFMNINYCLGNVA